MPSKTLRRRIKNDLSEIGIANRAIDDFIACQELPARIAFELNLALDEILNNIISYGYDDDRRERFIEIRGFLADSLITLEVEDDGRPFNPLSNAIKEPDLTSPIPDRQVGGLGIFLVKKMVDELEYQRRDDKNILILKKRVVSQAVKREQES